MAAWHVRVGTTECRVVFGLRALRPPRFVFIIGSIRPYLEAACKWYSEANAGPGAEAGAGFRDYKNSVVQYSMCCSIGAAGFRPSSRAHDAGLSPCARNTIREAISRTRRAASQLAASMQDTLSEGTARAAQLAPSAVTASAVGGSATRSVVADSLRRRAARARSTHARAIARRRGCFLGCVSCKFSHFKFGQQSSLFQDISGFLKNERKREKRRW